MWSCFISATLSSGLGVLRLFPSSGGLVLEDYKVGKEKTVIKTEASASAGDRGFGTDWIVRRVLFSDLHDDLT